MVGKTKNIDKRMEAGTATMLKHMLDIELRNVKEKDDVDAVLFMGVDGRMFSSNIPFDLSPPQYRLLNLVKAHIPHICGQLSSENLKISVQYYGEGTIVIAGVGDNAFMVLLFAKGIKFNDMEKILDHAEDAGTILNHLFESRPITPEGLKGYNKKVQIELTKLSRQLFVERFEETREFQKNMEILKFVKQKIQDTVGIGAVDEIVTVSFNELGTSAAYMNDDLWKKFFESVVERIGEMGGEVTAEKFASTSVPEIEKKLKSFV
ncbi:MAG: hypothetical protein V3U09_01905 [Thermoplasmata archaeon]